MVATSHTADKLEKRLDSKSMKGEGRLHFESNVNITDSSALMQAELWKGVSQVVTAVGPAFGRQSDGSMGYVTSIFNSQLWRALYICSLLGCLQPPCNKAANTYIYTHLSVYHLPLNIHPLLHGQVHCHLCSTIIARDLCTGSQPKMVLFFYRYLDNMTSERVDAEGVSNIAKAAQQFLPQRSFQPETEQVISMRNKEDLEVWEKLDDTIMGGKSGSFLQVHIRTIKRILPLSHACICRAEPCLNHTMCVCVHATPCNMCALTRIVWPYSMAKGFPTTDRLLFGNASCCLTRGFNHSTRFAAARLSSSQNP